MTEWAVEVTLERNPKYEYSTSPFLGVNVELLITEIFRYAGTIDVVRGRDEGPELVFVIYRAGLKGNFDWASMNAKRINSFGIAAVAKKLPVNARLAV